MDQLPVIDVALAAILVPILTGLGEALKRAFQIPPAVLPLLNVGLGLLLTVGYVLATKWPDLSGGLLATAVLTGVVVGLTSSHLYDAGRAVLGPTARSAPRRP